MKTKTQSEKLVMLTAIVALVLIAFSSPIAQSTNEPTLEECRTAWQDSGAFLSCGHAQIHNNLAQISVSDEECKINVDCSTTHVHSHVNNDWQGSSEDMKKLNNCNGHLKVGDC